MKTRTRAAIVTSLAAVSLTSVAAATGVPVNGVIAIGQYFSQPNGPSYASGLTGDGRFAVYDSWASNLASGDNNNNLDVFLYDRAFARTLLMSVASSGGAANGFSSSTSTHNRIVTDDARYVLFSSYANNLIAGDTNGTVDGFLRDTSGFGSTTRVTLGTGGSQITVASNALGMSADADRILFATVAALSPRDTNGTRDLYVYERSTSRTTLISSDASGNALGEVDTGTISDNGRYFAFRTTASLVGFDTNGLSDIYWKDVTANVFRLASATVSNVAGNAPSVDPVMSSDGQTVSFQSTATNLVVGDSNGASDVFVKRISDGSITRASTKTNGIQVANPGCTSLNLNANGTIVVMGCAAPDMVPGDTNGVQDVFTKDLTTGLTTRVSVSSSGEQGALGSDTGYLSADGSLVLFTTLSPLSPWDTNNFAEPMTASRQ